MQLATVQYKRARRLSLTGAAAAVVVTAASLTPSFAVADEGTSAVDQVLDASPAAENAASLDVQDAEIEGNTVTVKGEESAITVTLPVSETPETNGGDIKALSDAASYDVVPVVIDDGSVAIHSVLNDSTAPTTYDYVLDLPVGTDLQIEDDGLVIGYNDDGTAAVYVAPPWATDANGDEVATYYTVQGNILTQHVEVDADTSFPVVADPWLGIDLVSYYSFSPVSGSGWRLNVGPTPWARGVTGNPTFPAIGAAGWDELRNQMNSTQRARLNNSGRDQYICHMGFAGIDPEWNMELWKPSKSLAAWIASQCN